MSVNGLRAAWQPGDHLVLPLHEIHAKSPDEPRESMGFLLNERDAEHWVFRRDPAIGLPLERAILVSGFGVPVLSTEIVLLFKAKSPRPKDEVDFHATGSALSDSSRWWLRSALATSDANHPWVQSLDL